MKKLVILAALGLSLLVNTSQAAQMSVAESNALVFDEDFGYTNKVFESGYYQGKSFKDIKAKILGTGPEILGPNQTSSSAAIACSFLGASMHLYCYKINPQAPESKYFQRMRSIETSREILQEAGKEVASQGRREKYYIITGKNLLSNDNLSQISDKEFEEWVEGKAEKYMHIIYLCDPVSFLQSLSLTIGDTDQGVIDIFKIINFQRDLEFFQSTKINFNEWQDSIPLSYMQLLKNEAALRCYYRYLYNLSILNSDDIKNNIKGNGEFGIGELDKDFKTELKKLLCPYAKYNSYCEAGYEEPEDHPVYKKLFGELKVNKYIMTREERITRLNELLHPVMK